MPWAIISLLIILGLGVPILQRVYDTFLNTTNGSWINWTTACSTLTGSNATYYPYEFSTFKFLPLLAGLMALAFLLALLGGAMQRRDDERRMRGEK